MSLCNCIQCGRIFLTAYEKRCKSCAQLLLDDSRKVKAYVRAHPRATLLEVYHQTGVSLSTIRELTD